MNRFRGSHPAKIDDKGRLKLPAAFKQVLDDAGVKEFYITSEDGERGQIWPLPKWEEREDLLAESSTMNEAVRRYVNITSHYGQQLEMDQQARVLIHQLLRTDAKLDKETEVVVKGAGDYMEVLSKALNDKTVEEDRLRTEDREALSALFRKKSA